MTADRVIDNATVSRGSERRRSERPRPTLNIDSLLDLCSSGLENIPTPP